jgi:hypothetical protein
MISALCAWTVRSGMDPPGAFVTTADEMVRMPNNKATRRMRENDSAKPSSSVPSPKSHWFRPPAHFERNEVKGFRRRYTSIELRQESEYAAPRTVVGRRPHVSQQDGIQAQTASRPLNQQHDLDNDEEEVRPRPFGPEKYTARQSIGKPQVR